MLRSMRGWRRLRPSHGRHPIPYEVACAAAAVMFSRTGNFALALAVLLCFDAYLRPYELLGLRFCDLLPPHGPFEHFSILIAPWEVQAPSKTKTFDDCVRLNSKLRPEVELLVRQLVTGCTGDRTAKAFPFTHQKLADEFSRALEFLWLSPFHFVLYSLRHGGPSADRATNARTPLEVQRRGRWALESSTKRYEQPGRLHVVLTRIPRPLWEYCEACRTAIVPLLLQQQQLQRPAMPRAPIIPPTPAEV